MIPNMLNPLGIFPVLRRLEYISSPTLKTIRTGFTFTGSKLGYELEIDMDNFSGNTTAMIGNWNGTTRDIFIYVYSGESYNYIPVMIQTAQVGGTAGSMYPQIPKTGYHSLSVLADDQTNTVSFSLDGSLVQSGSYTGNMLTGMPMNIAVYAWRLKRFKIMQDNIPVRDFIPALDSDNTSCVFDTVNRKIYHAL